LIGATTRLGLLTTPLRDRFGIPIRLDFYSDAELEIIVRRGARIMGAPITDSGAKRSPAAREARRALPGGCSGACATSPLPTASTRSRTGLADKALLALEVDAHGLDSLDRRYPVEYRAEFRRRAGRHRDDFRRLVERATHRGYRRTLSHPAGLSCSRTHHAAVWGGGGGWTPKASAHHGSPRRRRKPMPSQIHCSPMRMKN
jgi:hypothetical protein